MEIQLKSVTFKNDRAQIIVETNASLTNEERNSLVLLLNDKYPNILSRTCKNSHGKSFADCVETTSIAHILEHVILEELADDSTRQWHSLGIYVGNTTKLSATLAKIELKYYDDIRTLRAINRATVTLNGMLAKVQT